MSKERQITANSKRIDNIKKRKKQQKLGNSNNKKKNNQKDILTDKMTRLYTTKPGHSYKRVPLKKKGTSFISKTKNAIITNVQ